MHCFGAIKRIAQPREEIYQLGDFLLILVWGVLWCQTNINRLKHCSLLD